MVRPAVVGIAAGRRLRRDAVVAVMQTADSGIATMRPADGDVIDREHGESLLSARRVQLAMFSDQRAHMTPSSPDDHARETCDAESSG